MKRKEIIVIISGSDYILISMQTYDVIRVMLIYVN